MLVEYHRTLVSDKVRSEAFRRALEKTIKKSETIAADVGAGTGFLSFLARKLGAKEVYLYEHSEVMTLCKQLSADNKMDGMHFFPEHSTAVIDPPQVDLVISETLGNYAFEEHIIANIEDSRRFLKPGGTIIPQKIEQFACPVTSDRFYKELCVWDDAGYGLDFSAAKEMSLNNIYVRAFSPEDLLDGGKAAQKWDNADLTGKCRSKRNGAAEWTAEADMTVYGFAVWWKCTLVPGVELATGPLDPKTHWEQLYFPVREPLAIKRDGGLSFAAASETSYEEGTVISWQIAGGGKKQAMDLRKGYLG